MKPRKVLGTTLQGSLVLLSTDYPKQIKTYTQKTRYQLRKYEGVARKGRRSKYASQRVAWSSQNIESKVWNFEAVAGRRRWRISWTWQKRQILNPLFSPFLPMELVSNPCISGITNLQPDHFSIPSRFSTGSGPKIQFVRKILVKRLLGSFLLCWNWLAANFHSCMPLGKRIQLGCEAGKWDATSLSTHQPHRIRNLILMRRQHPFFCLY